jgi:hypothetical protein
MFSDPFAGPDDVITNHYAMWNGHDDPNAHRSVNYEVESGTLYRQDGVATTGLPTWAQPLTADSSDGSGNDIFRMWTRRSDFGNDYVHMRLRFDGWTEGHAPEWPAQPWDGVKIWLRRSGASGSYALYTAEVSRRQGNVMIQKKCAGSDAYTVLAQSKDNRPVETGLWETVGGGAYNDSNGTVLLGVVRDGKLVLTARDSGAGGCDPITAPGRVGVRGDNARFAFDDLTITSLDRGTTTAQPAPAPPHARGAP